MRFAFIAFLLLTGLSLFQIFYYYEQLPASMATHFNGAGDPDGWSTPKSFVVFSLAIIGTVVLSFLLIHFILQKIPPTAINLPNRDHWIAPERLPATVAFIQAQLLWFGGVTMVLLICVYQLVIDANLNPPVRLSANIWWYLLVYGLYTVIWLVRFWRRFSRV